MYAIAERRDSNKQPYRLSIAAFSSRRRNNVYSFIFDNNGLLTQNNRHFNADIDGMIYGSIWYYFHVLPFPQSHVNRRQMNINASCRDFWNPERHRMKARRGSRSAHLCCLTCLLTRLHCCRLDHSLSLSISRPVCLWTSWTIATTNLGRVMCQYAYVSVHNASHYSNTRC